MLDRNIAKITKVVLIKNPITSSRRNREALANFLINSWDGDVEVRYPNSGKIIEKVSSNKISSQLVF